MPSIDRRTVLKSLAGFAGTFLATAALPSAAAAPRSLTSGRFHFPQGVASGDPQPDGVVLWTRVEANEPSDAPVDVRVQISQAPDFASIVLDEMLPATIESDHTLRLVVQGLEPDTIYFYRFSAGGDQSRLGRTRIVWPWDAHTDLHDVPFMRAAWRSYFDAREQPELKLQLLRWVV